MLLAIALQLHCIYSNSYTLFFFPAKIVLNTITNSIMSRINGIPGLGHQWSVR